VRDGITDAGLRHFQAAYPGAVISKEDLFYYLYGLLHCEEYKTRYADNLSKELPRIPAVKTYTDFKAFSDAGRALAELHIDYEKVAMYAVNIEGLGFVGSNLFDHDPKDVRINSHPQNPDSQDTVVGANSFAQDADFRVTQMKFAKGVDGNKHDKTRVIYNAKITLTGIPLAAYDYIVNGKPALEWVMERQAVTTHKDSGIVNDANLWATETMGDAAYPLKLFQRVITVSLETMKIVRGLPKLEIV
jgi:predicted helicase